jgi:hypothetical protein
MARGRKPTCECGECQKCRRRDYQREYQRQRRARVVPSEAQRAAKAEATRRWREANPERDRERWRHYQQSDSYKDYQREYRQKHRAELSAADLARYHAAEDKAKYRARGKVYDAIRRGRMTRGSCEVCGRQEAHAHHDDYDRPLDVRWLCPQHHAEHHRSAA